MNEKVVSISLWLPVGRANFYSSTANNWLLKSENSAHAADHTLPATSRLLAESGYRPRLQVSVLRRVLEVLPVSFGYERLGRCTFAEDDPTRPVAVTMTLRPRPDLAQRPAGPERSANLSLVAAGIDEVTCRVDEHGAYTFTARARLDAGTDVRAALADHVHEVFGGDYSLDRRSSRHAANDNAGGTAVRAYQGLDTGSAAAEEKPRGILTFFQLNTLVEGLFNESLSPAVFFEQNEDLDAYLRNARPGSLTMIRRMSEVVGLLEVHDVDATEPAGLLAVVRRFLDVTGREVLQRLKWSVESVRRSLLDESVGMLHRQSKLVQLDLGALRKEWSPELAEGASESQLRGFVMLAAAKLPLVANVHEYAVLAREHLSRIAAHRGVPAAEVEQLAVEIKHWNTLLNGLRSNVQGLEDAIEHAWRENLLYEQRAVRSEQEAMAEIARSRSGQPGSERGTMNAYNIATLLFTVAAVLIAIREGNILDTSSVSLDWWRWLRALTPIALVTVVFTMIVPLYNRSRRKARDKQGYSETYPYEFAFRLEEAADPAKVFAYLSDRKPRMIRSKVLKELTLTSQGGGRIERVSQHRALVKIHSIATFRVGRGHYARFEIVKEILAHRVSGHPTFMIIQCRMFGDSPRPLEPGEVLEFTTMVLEDVGTKLTGEDPLRGDSVGIEVPEVLGLISPLLSPPAPAEPTPAAPREPTTVRLPSQVR